MMKTVHTLICDLFFLSTLLYNGHAQDAVLTIEPNWSTYFPGESVTFICDMNEGDDDDWEYRISKDGRDFIGYYTNPKYTLKPLGTYYSGNYQCHGRHKSTYATKDSNTVSLTVTANKPKARLIQDSRSTSVGGSVRLSCSVENSAGWKYDWFRRTSDTSEVAVRTKDGNGVIRVSQGGIYRCRGSRGEPAFYTGISDEVTCQITFSNKVVVMLRPSWSQIFRGETITLTCEVQGGETTEWEYEWRTSGSETPRTNKHWTFTASEFSSGDYRCKTRLRDDPHSSTEWSEAFRLSLSREPKVQLSAAITVIPVGGRVTLSCSVKPSSSGWRYYWYRDEESSKPLTSLDADFYSDGRIRVSQEGVYWCRGGRGEPVYYTKFSDPVTISRGVSNRSVVTLHPNWPQIYRGEKITLRCGVHGGDSNWEYEWKTSSSKKPPNLNEFSINSVSSLNTGTYQCKGRMERKHLSTKWSDSFTLTILDNPEPVLTVSPSWLSPGASVTLSCEVKHPSAGWRFYWYKAVPQPSTNSYIYELLPGSTSGTELDSYIIDGQTHTAGYACRAGRGDPVVYTLYSRTKMVCSADPHPSASLTVSPDRVQHFTSDSVSLTCEGNSAEWRVRRSTVNSYSSFCSYWGTMKGPTCVVNGLQSSNSVYWCESGSLFSNAVNLTGQTGDIILVSPVHPVTEGASVSLSCRLRRQNQLSSVFFYHNDKLIQNDSREELNISAVSQSDEGFYKCQHSGNVSPQSWMSVRTVSRTGNSSFPVLLIVGPVSALIILLLLLCCCRHFKDSCFLRRIQSESTSHSSNTNQEANQYGTLLFGNSNVYETIRSSGVTRNGLRHEPEEAVLYSDVMTRTAEESKDATYSLTEHKNLGPKRQRHEPEEAVLYSDVMTRTAGFSPVYDYVN